MTETAVFLERECRVIPDGKPEHSNYAQNEQVLSLTELAQQPAFVLLGEPGMGKTSSLIALAKYLNGHYITAQNFILEDSDTLNSERFYCIDALDEARVKNSSSILTEIRKLILKAELSKFCIACRIADWFTTDNEHFQHVAPEKSLTIAELQQLSKSQNIRLLTIEGIEKPEEFLNKVDELGFADMLGNPQSLKILAAAVKQNNQQWPTQRSEAFELACTSLLREHNKRHKEAQRGTLVSNEDLLDAAGWLCSLMLLSNQTTIADTDVEDLMGNALHIESVLEEFSGSHHSIATVLQRRIFQKTGNNGGFTPVHRTIAEYLAARYLSQQIEASGLLAGRVASLMLASSEHLVSNLRGLAGWLAALSGPMRDRIFAADPAAVLDYGDLSLLTTTDKQTLITILSEKESIRTSGYWWSGGTQHLPLVQEDMQSFMLNWLQGLSKSPKLIREPKKLITHRLLDALENQKPSRAWENKLNSIVQKKKLPNSIRQKALKALARHSSHKFQSYLNLLNDIYDGKIEDKESELTGSILHNLYPENLPPHQVIHYFKSLNDSNFGRYHNFWTEYLIHNTPDNLLSDWMYALDEALTDGKIKPDADGVYYNDHNRLSSIIVRAIRKLGSTQSAQQLSKWLDWCDSDYESPFRIENPEDNQKLSNWKQAHPQNIKAVISYRLRNLKYPYLAGHGTIGEINLPEIGLFWLNQAKLLIAEDNISDNIDRSIEALLRAFSYLENSSQAVEISLENIEYTASLHPQLTQALENRRWSKIEDNWRRRRWHNKNKRVKEQEKYVEKRKKDLISLLEQLDSISSGKNLYYLYYAAWAESEIHYVNNGDHNWVLKQLAEHPELKKATHEGYLSCLESLTLANISEAETARQNNKTLLIKLPAFLGAKNLFEQGRAKLLSLDTEILDTLSTLTLRYSTGNIPEWLITLSTNEAERMKGIWWDAYHDQLKSKHKKKEVIRLPFFYELNKNSQLTELRQELLIKTLENWPLKIASQNLATFADLLIALIYHSPQELPEPLHTRLQKKSISATQKAYLITSGMWTAPQQFKTKLIPLLERQPSSRNPYLGFISYIYKYGRHDKETLIPPVWDANIVSLFFRLFAPLCPPSYPMNAYSPTTVDNGRSFLHALGEQLLSKPDEHGAQMLQALKTNKKLTSWQAYFEELLTDYTQALAEKNFTTPAPKQVAQVLQNKKPANQNDLMAVTLEALNQLQNEIKNSPTNLIHRFWNVDPNGQKPIPPHRPETECRNVIADWLAAHLKHQGITLLPELLHGAGNQSDIGLLTQRPNQTDLLLPIEIKGDWNKSKNGRDLWHAPRHQLYDKYVTDQRTGGNGLYLVLWMGEPNKVAPHPNRTKLNTADALQKALTQQMENLLGEAAKNIKLFVLDLSISTRNSQH